MESVSLVCFINSILSKGFHILSIIVFSCGPTNMRNVIHLAAHPINRKRRPMVSTDDGRLCGDECLIFN